jgi:hypothetical protein
MENQQITTVALLAVVFVQGYFIFQMNKEVENLECDLVSAFFAEREYTYPALRELGFEPNELGLDVENPITTNLHYARGCE